MLATLFEIPQSIFADDDECAYAADRVESANLAELEKSGRVAHGGAAMNAPFIPSR
jgi:hypothetical protein